MPPVIAALAAAAPAITAGAALAGVGLGIDQQQKAHQSSEDAKKIANQNKMDNAKLLQDAENVKTANKATEATQLASGEQRRRQGAYMLSSRGAGYTGAGGTATLLGGAGVSPTASGKTLLGS